MQYIEELKRVFYRVRTSYNGYLSGSPAYSVLMRPKFCGLTSHKREACLADGSRASRRRFLQMSSQIRWDDVGPCTECTLTFAPKFQTHERRSSNAIFLRWCRHVFYDGRGKPKMSAIWCAERCKRGQIHYHLIVFGVLSKEEVVASWRHYSGCVSQAICIRAISQTPGRVASYFAKYMGKGSSKSVPSAPGVRGDARSARGTACAGSADLDNGAYSCLKDTCHSSINPSGGRTWGRIGWNKIPSSPDKIAFIEIDTPYLCAFSKNLARYFAALTPYFPPKMDDRQSWYEAYARDCVGLGYDIRQKVMEKRYYLEDLERKRRGSVAILT